MSEKKLNQTRLNHALSRTQNNVDAVAVGVVAAAVVAVVVDVVVFVAEPVAVADLLDVVIVPAHRVHHIGCVDNEGLSRDGHRRTDGTIGIHENNFHAHSIQRVLHLCGRFQCAYEEPECYCIHAYKWGMYEN